MLALLLLLALTAGPAWAQRHRPPVQVPDSVEGGSWKANVSGKLAGSQAAYRNWQEGGLNTLALTSTVDARVERETDHWVQVYDLRLSFGIIQQDTLEIRKAEDLIRFASALRYIGEDVFRTFNPTIALGLRTQFAAGFNYDKDPLGLGRNPPVRTSDFFAPASITQSLGLTYTPAEGVLTRLSAAGKETIVLIKRLRPLYDVRPTNAVRYETGVESVTQIDQTIMKNIRLQSTLTLFKALVEPQPVDMIAENLITMKVNDWINVGLEYVMIYDANQSKQIQIKEILSVGVAFRLI